MADDTAGDEVNEVVAALRDITEAVIEVAGRLYGLPDGTVARCPR